MAHTDTIHEAHVPLAERAYRGILELIGTGQLGPRTRVKIRDVARQLGVSPMPVREAIARLVRDKLLDLEPRKGATVRWYSLKEIRDIMEARAALEGMGARLACGRLTPARLEELDALGSRIEQMQVAGQSHQSGPLEEQFHGLIIDAAGNDYIKRLLEDGRLLMRCSQIARVVDLVRSIGPNRDTVPPDHFAIIKALRSGDAVRVEAAARDHVLNAMVGQLRDAEEALRILEGRPTTPEEGRVA